MRFTSESNRYTGGTKDTVTEDTSERVELSAGTLFKPQSAGVQFVSLFAVFVVGPGLGWVIAEVLGGVSRNGQIALYIPYVAILFLGYGLWSVRLKTIAFRQLGLGFFRAVLMMLVRRKKPDNLEKLLPTKETLETMAVQAQSAASSFVAMSVPVAGVSGLLALGLTSETSAPGQMVWVAGSCLFWGWLLSRFARRGYLPIMEEGG